MAFEIEVKHIHPDDSPREHAMYHARGCQQIDNGLYGRVFDDKSANQIIKVFSGHDAGYNAYLEVMSRLDIDNPHLPKIHHVVMYKNGDDVYQNCSVVYMEKLTKGKVRTEFDDNGCQKGPMTWHERIVSRVKLIAWAMNGGEQFPHLNAKHQELFALLCLARERGQQIAPEHGVEWDLHTGNIMWRGSTWVVTDPLS